MNKETVVNLSNLVSRQHEDWGGTAILFDGQNAASAYPDLEVFPIGDTLQVEGAVLFPKQHVRKMLWENRQKVEQLKARPTAVIWSAYDPKAGRSEVGIGVMVASAEALDQRMEVADGTARSSASAG